MKENNEKKFDKDLIKDDVIETQHNLDKLGDDAQLVNRNRTIDFAGEDLDIPGRKKLPSQNILLKDEENQVYSQGSTHNDHLEGITHKL